MAYLTFLRNGVEIGRCPLEGPVVIGRAADCHVCVHDILLSRRHCRIQPTPDDGWMIIDLNSKNGTRKGRDRIDKLVLRDGSELSVGKTMVRFSIGDLPEGASLPKGPLGKRPTDPYEALAGTVTDFDPTAAVNYQRKLNLPTPKPMPPIPDSLARDGVYRMLNEIASSSWDSIYATASRPRRPLPERVGTMPVKNILPIQRPRTPSENWSLEARAPARQFIPPTPIRPVRPARPKSVRRRSWIGRQITSVAGTIHRWVAPRGAVRLL